MFRQSLAALMLVVALAACARDLPTTTTPDDPALAFTGPLAVSSSNISLVSRFPGMFKDGAFQDKLAFLRGDANESAIVDISDPVDPRLLARFRGDMGQGAVSVYGKYVFDSHEEGIDVLDVSDPVFPQSSLFRGSPCGSRNHTLKADAREKEAHLFSAPASAAGGCSSGFDLLTWDLTDPSSGTMSHVPYPVGITSCRHFAVVDGPNHRMALALCKDGAWDVAQTWDISDPRNPMEVGRLWAPAGRNLYSAAYSSDAEVVALGDDHGTVHFHHADDIGGPPTATFTPPRRGSGPGSLACAVSFVPGASDPYYAVLGCGINGLSVVAFDIEDAGATEYGFYTPAGSNAQAATYYAQHIYMTDLQNGLFVFKDKGARIGRNPRTGQMIKIPSRSNPRSAPN